MLKKTGKAMGDSGTWGTQAQMDATRTGGAKQLAAFKKKPTFTQGGNKLAKLQLTGRAAWDKFSNSLFKRK